MATLFPVAPGQVAVLTRPEFDPALPVTLDGVTGSAFPALRAILTNFSISLRESHQFQPTLGDVTFAYAFGADLGALRLGGVAFLSDCVGTFSGVERVLDHYQAQRMAARGRPTQVQIGSTAAGRFRGFLTGMAMQVKAAEDGLAQFALELRVYANPHTRSEEDGA